MVVIRLSHFVSADKTCKCADEIEFPLMQLATNISEKMKCWTRIVSKYDEVRVYLPCQDVHVKSPCCFPRVGDRKAEVVNKTWSSHVRMHTPDRNKS